MYESFVTKYFCILILLISHFSRTLVWPSVDRFLLGRAPGAAGRRPSPPRSTWRWCRWAGQAPANAPKGTRGSAGTRPGRAARQALNNITESKAHESIQKMLWCKTFCAYAFSNAHLFKFQKRKNRKRVGRLWLKQSGRVVYLYEGLWSWLVPIGLDCCQARSRCWRAIRNQSEHPGLCSEKKNMCKYNEKPINVGCFCFCSSKIQGNGTGYLY